jgi:dCMP deaminase|nr:MAG TPA: Deoxycytidylate deaminase [Caudoviricetes sp.]
MGNRRMTTEEYLNLAHEYALKFSGCTKVKVGSIITSSNGSIIAFGANAAIPDLCRYRGCLRIEKYGDNAKAHRLPSDCRALHSEIDAICHVSGTCNAPKVIYVTRYPCEACARAIVAAGILRVVYGRSESISEETVRIFESANVEVVHAWSWTAEDNNT